MLQMFPLDVTKVDLVLHTSQWTRFYWAHLHARGCGEGASGNAGTVRV
jgi:hypothetical protein